MGRNQKLNVLIKLSDWYNENTTTGGGIIMSVHKAISAHSQQQHERIRQFLELEQQREEAIDEAVSAAMDGERYEVTEINRITDEMNALARKGAVPLRKNVTIKMVEAYAKKKSGKG